MLIAIILSLLAGGSIVLARTVNAHLAEKSSLLQSTFYNYIVGLLISLIVLLIVNISTPITFVFVPLKIWFYTGGIVGVMVVLISNATVAKVSSFYMTLLLFIGQVFTGVIIDVLITGAFSIKYIIGGLLVAIGLSINVFIDKQ